MIYLIPGGGLLGERPVVPGGRQRTERQEQLQRQVEGDTGPVVKAKMGIWQPDMPSIEGGVRSVSLAKSEAHRRMEASRDHGHPELHPDYAFLGRETEDRASPILVGRFSKDRWLITHRVPRKSTQHQWIVGKLVNDVIMSGVQTLVVKSDQEVSIVNVKKELSDERIARC